MKTINSKFSIIIIFFSGIICSFSYSQNYRVWEWATNIVGTNKNIPYSLVTDKNGNNYIAGSFTDTLKIGNKKLVSNGYYDIYFLKYDAKGNLIWAKQAGGTDDDGAYGLTSDDSGNLYLTGYFSGTADFSGIQVKCNNERDFFVAKYNSNGDLVWIKQGNETIEGYGTAIATDKSGNVFITGIFKGVLQIENSKYISEGDYDIFIIKYNSEGKILWSATGGGDLHDESTAIVTDKNGDCYITGDFEVTAAFNNKRILSAGKKDVFLAKYNSDGKIQWLKRGGSATGDDHVSSIGLDKSENIYITGYFSGRAKFGDSELKNMGSDDIFLVKYNPDGEEIWAKQTGGKGEEHARALKLDEHDNIYVTGEFNVDFTFGEDNIKHLLDWDIFIIKYSNTGEMIGGTQIGGNGYDKAFAIGLDGLSNIYIVGYFSKAISIGNTNLTSIDADDSFIAKLNSF